MRFAEGLAYHIAQHDKRKAQNAAARARCRANAALAAHVEGEARRRGLVRQACAARCVDCVAAERADLERAWTDYFRGIDVNYP